jgi:carbon monoxide dehydrogenase subunit G
MTMHVVVDQLIDAPVAAVWADVSEMATHAEWMTDAESISFAGDRRSGMGTVMIVPTRVGPFTTEDWIIVTHWEEQRAMGVIHVGIVSGVGMFRLEPEGERTRFVWEEELTLPWALGGPLGEIVAKPIIGAIWKANLSRLAARFG